MTTNGALGGEITDLSEMLEQVVEAYQSLQDCSNGKTFSCAEELVLRLGTAFRPPGFVSGPGRRLTEERFAATARFAKDQRLIYVEGYARLPGLPTVIHHAWCVQRGTDEAIDVTTANINGYIGIPFRQEAVQFLCEEPSDSRVLSNVEGRCPLLRMSRQEILALIEHL